LAEELAHLACHAPEQRCALINTVQEAVVFELTVVFENRTNQVEVSEHALDPVVV
jgi:hypothetical protein